MAAPNLLSATTATGKTAVQAIGTSATAIVSNGSSSGKAIFIQRLQVANVHASNAGLLTVDHYRSSTAVRMTKTFTIAPGASIVPVEKLWLEEADDLRLTADAASTLEGVASYVEFS